MVETTLSLGLVLVTKVGNKLPVLPCRGEAPVRNKVRSPPPHDVGYVVIHHVREDDH